MKMNRFFLIYVIFFLFGCANRIETLDSMVKSNSFKKEIYTTDLFEHLVIENNKKSHSLHIYIEGDGIPWRTRTMISKDPTPHNPLALKLMSQDSSRAIYLGRPCYFGLNNAKNCSIKQWASGRYGENIITSMELVIRKYNKKNNIKQFVLIGYSGGGVIATLLSDRFEEDVAYVTIASNLDIDKWTELHDYSPLIHSLNPAKISLNKGRFGVHLVGSQDKNVPPEVVIDFIKQSNGKMVTYKGYNHICCWVDNWQRILNENL